MASSSSTTNDGFFRCCYQNVVNTTMFHQFQSFRIWCCHGWRWHFLLFGGGGEQFLFYIQPFVFKVLPYTRMPWNAAAKHKWWWLWSSDHSRLGAVTLGGNGPRALLSGAQNLKSQNVHFTQKRLGLICTLCWPISHNNGQFALTKRTKIVTLPH